MLLVERINDDLQVSQRQRQTERVSALRMLKASLKNKAIDERVDERTLSDEHAVQVLRHEVKKRQEAIEAYAKGGRADLAGKEEAERGIIRSYLPPSLSEADIDTAISDVVSDAALEPPYQFGTLMGMVMKKLEGRAEGTAVKDRVQKFITSR